MGLGRKVVGGRDLASLALFLTLGCLLPGGVHAARAGQALPYRDLSRCGAGFFGPGRADSAPAGLRSVRIGVVGPQASPVGRALRAGVARAVAEANARGGYDGLPFEVVLRAEDGPWGSGSKQVTALAVEDSVWVILGGLDGGGAHLAEMIAAKLWVPVITITAADRTIDFANVPWVFRCFPSDDRQACALLNYARGCAYDSLVVFSEAAREGRTGARRLLDAAHRQQVLLAGPLEYDPRTPEACLGSADLGSADAVLIWGPAASGQALLRALRHEGFPGPVLGPACLLSEELLQGGSAWGEVTVAAPYDWGCENPRRREFCRRYEAEAGRTCEPTAVFAFDAACMAMTAIQQAGLNRARIRDALASGSFPTAAGFLRFDSLGGSSVEPVLLTMREGIWAAVDPGER